MATNGNLPHHTTSAADAAPEASPTPDQSNLPKEEVGWYFVEQYYTTLSKTPEKVHLFHGKKSQFVGGHEAVLSQVAVGRNAIAERIKQLDFQDCKVRVSNVDTQGSGENIVIQVIGEISNKGGEPNKFVQTFVLAKQPSGYFVLNDILRYIDDDAQEEPAAAEPAPEAQDDAPAVEAEAEPEVEAEVAAEVPVQVEEEKEAVELDTAVVDQKLEEASAVVEEAPVEEAAVETPVEAAPEPEEPAVKEPETLPDPEKAAEEVAEEEIKKPEEPKGPTPTPAVAAVTRTPAPPAAEPEEPKEPPKPMTWASRAAAAAGPRPVVPLAKTAATPAATQPRAAAPANAGAAQPATAAPVTEAPAAASSKDQSNEWQTAEAKRQSRIQPVAAAAPDKENTAAYIKYVTDKVKDDDLKATLSSFGELTYFDINRLKNCAFVEFKTLAGYNAAVAANPHTVNGENILVEQRRPKATAYGGSAFNPSRGGTAGRGRGGFDGGRTPSQGGNRTGFSGQTRGGRGGGAPRGRGASQAGTA